MPSPGSPARVRRARLPSGPMREAPRARLGLRRPSLARQRCFVASARRPEAEQKRHSSPLVLHRARAACNLHIRATSSTSHGSDAAGRPLSCGSVKIARRLRVGTGVRSSRPPLSARAYKHRARMEQGARVGMQVPGESRPVAWLARRECRANVAGQGSSPALLPPRFLVYSSRP